MSIYSGFATRMLEHSYNTVLFSMIHHLANRLTEFVGQGIHEQIWTDEFSKLYKHLIRFESQKYLPPKFSSSLQVLAVKYDCASSFNSVPISRDSTRSRPKEKEKDSLTVAIPNPIYIPNTSLPSSRPESVNSVPLKLKTGRRFIIQDRLRSSETYKKTHQSTSLEYEVSHLDVNTPKIRTQLFRIKSNKKKRMSINSGSGKYVQDMALLQLYNEIGAT